MTSPVAVLATAEESSVAAAPCGMAVVSKDAFFEALRADARDVMPIAEFDSNHRSHSDWVVMRTRELWGWSSDGRFARVGGAK